MAEVGYVGLGVMGGCDRARACSRRTRRDRLEPHAREGGAAPRAGAPAGPRVRARSPSAASSSSRWSRTPRLCGRSPRARTGSSPGSRRASLRRHEHREPGEHARARRAGAEAGGRDARLRPSPARRSRVDQGKVSLMVGGDDDDLRAVQARCSRRSARRYPLGPNGSAVTMKIAINLSLAVQMLAFSEGVLLAEKSGIPREKAVEVMLAIGDRVPDGRLPRAARARAARTRSGSTVT